MRTLAEEKGVAWEKVSGGVGLGKGVTAVVALCSAIGMKFAVAVQVLFVAAVKLVGGALRVVQEVEVWLVYL